MGCKPISAEVVAALRPEDQQTDDAGWVRVHAAPTVAQTSHHGGWDLRDVKGQTAAKRALEVAAAGGHSLVMVGPPGTGKSMLAQRFVTLLPDMTDAEALESALSPVWSGGLSPPFGVGVSFARLITVHRLWPWWAAARRRVPAKYLSRTTACCF